MVALHSVNCLPSGKPKVSNEVATPAAVPCPPSKPSATTGPMSSLTLNAGFNTRVVLSLMHVLMMFMINAYISTMIELHMMMV